MSRRRREPEEHVNHERWLVSYADFITLLFAFFVVMYSISSVNEGKYKVLSDTLVGVFNQPERSTKPIAIGEEPPRTLTPDLDAAPEQGSTPPAPIIALTPPAPQPPEIPVESTQSTARGQMAARLRQAQRAGGLPQPEVLLPLSARLAALRDRLAEGTRKRPR